MPVIPAIQGGTNRKIVVQAGLGIKAKPCIKNEQHKKGWWSGSSGSEQALPAVLGQAGEQAGKAHVHLTIAASQDGVVEPEEKER
jgi:hypothetical protein